MNIFEAYIYIMLKKCEVGYSHSDLSDKYKDFVNFYELNPNVSRLGTTFINKDSYRIF